MEIKIKNASKPPPKDVELQQLIKARKLLAEHMKDKLVIGPFTVSGLDDAGAITQAAIIAPTATEDIKIILFKVGYSGEISEMEVATFDELKENSVEDFPTLLGQNFYFVCEHDA